MATVTLRHTLAQFLSECDYSRSRSALLKGYGVSDKVY